MAEKDSPAARRRNASRTRSACLLRNLDHAPASVACVAVRLAPRQHPALARVRLSGCPPKPDLLALRLVHQAHVFARQLEVAARVEHLGGRVVRDLEHCACLEQPRLQLAGEHQRADAVLARHGDPDERARLDEPQRLSHPRAVVERHRVRDVEVHRLDDEYVVPGGVAVGRRVLDLLLRADEAVALLVATLHVRDSDDDADGACRLHDRAPILRFTSDSKRTRARATGRASPTPRRRSRPSRSTSASAPSCARSASRSPPAASAPAWRSSSSTTGR